MNPQRELLAYEEKIALARLEEAKAAERVRELEYQKSVYMLEFFIQEQHSCTCTKQP